MRKPPAYRQNRQPRPTPTQVAPLEGENPEPSTGPTLLAEVSHDLRTSAATIVGYAEILSQSPRLAPADNRLLSAIRDSGQHLLEMLDSMLDVSQSQAACIGPVANDCDIRHELKNALLVIDSGARSKNLKLITSIDPALTTRLPIQGVAVRRILTNLLTNAVKYSLRGDIRVRFDLEHSDTASDRGGQVLRLQVQDQGIGMPADELKTLGRPFSRGRRPENQHIEGRGLGVSITQRLIEQLGGSLYVQSVPMVGSTFTVRLPFGQTSEILPETPTRRSYSNGEDESEPAASGGVLIIEDDPHLQWILQMRLQQAGLNVQLAQDGHQALAADWRSCEAVLLDLALPGCDGRQIAQALREAGYRRPIIALTARPVSLALEAGLIVAGINDIVSKADSVDLVLETLAKWTKSPCPVNLPTSRTTEKRRPASDDTWIADPRYRALLKSYLGKLPELVSQLHQAFRCNDLQTLKNLSHRLQGTSAMYGFYALSAASGRLHDVATPQGEHSDIRRLIGRIETIVEQLSSDPERTPPGLSRPR